MPKAKAHIGSPCKKSGYTRIMTCSYKCKKEGGRKGQGKGRARANHTCRYGKTAAGLCRKPKRGERLALRNNSATAIQKLFRGKLGRQVGSLVKEGGGLKAIMAAKAPPRRVRTAEEKAAANRRRKQNKKTRREGPMRQDGTY